MKSPLRVHLVWSHPRLDSLTATVVGEIRSLLESRGAVIDELDLHRVGFDPVLREPDEPDWEDEDKRYSPEVEALVDRVQRADIIVAVFPLWWYGLPAMLKGYVDRVWNNGRMYGTDRRANARAMVWVALAGLPLATLAKRGFDRSLHTMLNDGIAGYCGIESSRVVILDDTLESVDRDAWRAEVDAALSNALGDALA